MPIVIFYTVASIATFVAYGWDKRRATRPGASRITERTLHTMELLGGWPGAIVGQRYFRHKWRKGSYMFAFWVIVLIHAVAWAVWFYR